MRRMEVVPISPGFVKFAEYASFALPVSILAGVGWFAHEVVSNKGIVDYRIIVGGVLLAGFTAWVGTMLLMAIGLDPMIAAPCAAILGASGERGYSFILDKAQHTLGDRKNDK